MTSLRSVPRMNPDFTVRDLGEETIIISSRGDMLHTLDTVGTFIYRSMDGSRTVADIVQLIVDAFDVLPAVAEGDVLRFLEELEHKDIVRIDLHSGG